MYVCVHAHTHAIFLVDHYKYLAVQAYIGLGYCTILHLQKFFFFFFRNGKKKPLQAELIASASPKCLNCIGKKSISYLLKPILTGLLEQHH